MLKDNEVYVKDLIFGCSDDTQNANFEKKVGVLSGIMGFSRSPDSILGFEPGLFDIRQDGSGGIFIDSGTVISKIDQDIVGRNAYRAVMGAFQSYYDAFKLERMGQINEGFQLCYKNRPGGFTGYPFLVYHFEGAQYVVDPENVHYFNVDQGYFCVALKAGNGISILGSWFRQNKRIIYDGNTNALQFYYEQCSSDASP
ncbi:hypothetical protein Patl1_04279 [Pistacia atlantica]|uniref:Uncharacterized protein n=1 Tax=Pistacia atlantica TaxID=434234 RepID=A0ACC1BQC7_9ROSI|nr:hypothetical protein Patl1_04279 [Pistacia atlantica]